MALQVLLTRFFFIAPLPVFAAEGKVIWKLLLKAGEKRAVTYRIELEYPKCWEIVGAE